MGFFKKRLSNATERSSGELNAFLGAGTEYSGRLEFVGTVRVDGLFHGEIVSTGTLVLGKEAQVRGQVRVGNLISNGRIYGDVEALDRAVLQKNSVLDGSLCTPTLVIEEGATVEGDVEMPSNGESHRVLGDNVQPIAGGPSGLEPDELQASVEDSARTESATY
ncbi:MAG: polymer-forming cytoskeletal protein [Desulfovibrionaceae bacterium]